jgi:YebC/PmpR family DNA-binding regulatory protein
MAGHSHSANIKYRKERVNAAKAKAFAKMARMLTVAAKLGGGDPAANPRLRLALEKARSVSMPKDNIERAIQKGTGDGSVGDYEEIVYEAYAPFGVAMILEILTDKRTRTAPEIRHMLEKAGGNLAASGAVAWMFERKAVFAIPRAEGLTEERVLEIVLDAGAEDISSDGDAFEVRAEPSDFSAVREALETAGVDVASAEVTYLPQTPVELTDVDEARRVLALIDALDDHDDVQTVHANYSFSDEVLAELGGGDA